MAYNLDYHQIGGTNSMQYTKEVEEMVCVAKGPNHGPAPIPEEGNDWGERRLL